ncbi:MAG: GIY-YIG nuclease family protein [Bacteroidetes bacterium]|nr:GIY-YIG nuclease family protein [Bacteroidota bacterium]
MLYFYILKCSDESYYVGVTNNVESRLFQHQEGIIETCYTFSRRPLELKYYEIIEDNLQAIKREKQIKGWTRAKKEALIAQNWDKLIEFSKNYKIRNSQNEQGPSTSSG